MSDFLTGYKPDDAVQRVTDERAGLVVPPSLSAPIGNTITQNRDVFDPPRRAQMKSNYCVRFAMCRALEHAEVKGGLPYIPFSPLFLGWHDAMQGDQGLNTGTQIYLSAAAANRYGVCSEDGYPWQKSAADDYLVRMRQRPPDDMYPEAERHQVVNSYRINDGNVGTMLDVLRRGFGFVFGMPLFTSFYDTGDDGIVNNTSGRLEGWHAMYGLDADVVGGVQGVWVDNSWSEVFGKEGRVFLNVGEISRFKDIRVVTGVEQL